MKPYSLTKEDLEMIRTNPEKNIQELASALAIDPSTVQYHRKRMGVNKRQRLPSDFAKVVGCFDRTNPEKTIEKDCDRCGHKFNQVTGLCS